MGYLTTRNNANTLTSWDRLFSDLWDNWGTCSNRVPSVDVKEEEKEYLIEADLPGFSEKDVDLKVENHILHISSNKEEKKEDKNDKYLLKERYSTSFERRFSLPEDINEDEIKARFENGVLSVSLPKKEIEKPKKIAISINQ